MYTVKILSKRSEIKSALQLAEDVFLQFEAPLFSKRVRRASLALCGEKM